jgi:hypothetical protein
MLAKFYNLHVLCILNLSIALFGSEQAILPWYGNNLDVSHEHLYNNVQRMASSCSDPQGMDIVIICSSTPQLSDFWEKRLQTTRSYLLPEKTIIICVDEDWKNPNGAGNGLGTLYAYHKAHIKALNNLGIDIIAQQAAGAAIAMYHTAGMGKRLAPLTISEFGVKSAVKLPGLIKSLIENDDSPDLITLLEATLKQSSVFAPSRKGRLSVFWSDQVFIPSNVCDYIPDSHIDILVKKIPAFSKEIWRQEGLDNYGLAVWNLSKEAKLFDKCNFETFQSLYNSNPSPHEQSLGISMGTFSLSFDMTLALMTEFQQELTDKALLLDSDPYFWMPLTLDWNSYLAAMQTRHVAPEIVKKHYDRMQQFRNKFQENTSSQLSGFFKAVDIGSDSYWWDYGTVNAYYQNNIKMTQMSTEGEIMRLFYNIPPLENCLENNIKTQNSAIIGSTILSGSVQNSLVVGVEAKYLNLNHCIMLGSTVDCCEAIHALLYQVNDLNVALIDPHYVRADAFLPHNNSHVPFLAPIDSDGKSNWKIKLPQNPCSWEEAVKWVSSLHVHEKLPQ